MTTKKQIQTIIRNAGFIPSYSSKTKTMYVNDYAMNEEPKHILAYTGQQKRKANKMILSLPNYKSRFNIQSQVE